ncbi:unnamed protein product [Amoebophrya sp. A25]|nr:unnamed protein product [Amoebophrya sp. A25]|eukprot:GSA25T00007390001.1
MASNSGDNECDELKSNTQFVKLSERGSDLVDRWQLRYFPETVNANQGKISRDLEKASGDKEALHKEIAIGDHHPDCFYQESKTAENMIYVTSTYGRGGRLSPAAVRVFSRFGRRVWFIRTRNGPRSRRCAGNDEDEERSHFKRDYMCALCGSAVDTQDALRFVASLFEDVTQPGWPPRGVRYFDIWSGGSGMKQGNGNGRPRSHVVENHVDRVTNGNQGSSSSSSSSSSRINANRQNQSAQVPVGGVSRPITTASSSMDHVMSDAEFHFQQHHAELVLERRRRLQQQQHQREASFFESQEQGNGEQPLVAEARRACARISHLERENALLKQEVAKQAKENHELKRRLGASSSSPALEQDGEPGVLAKRQKH